ncbi:hypothetical protein BH09SUM1_BH09SUM1_06670 [soil metagenome]
MKKLLVALWFLALGILIGAQLGAGLIAPLGIFSFVESKLITTTAAATIAGGIFRQLSHLTFAVLAVTLASLSILKLKNPWPVIALVAACLALQILETAWITPRIIDLRTQLDMQFGEVAAAPKDNPLRHTFGMMHGLSAMRLLLQLGLETAAFLYGAGTLLSRAARLPPE